jgi:hypothetical protein
MSDEANKWTNESAVRFVAWGAVAGMVLATSIIEVIAGSRMDDPLWATRLSLNGVLAIGRWVGLPAGALMGAICGLAISRREATMSAEARTPHMRPDDWRLRWTSRGIGMLTLAWGVATQSLLHNHSLELRVSVVFLGGVCVYFLSWAIPWLCGIRPFGG